ncbi:hypothetical protein T261_2503 [Streptomyces lydicus]|nr:hypothetical protein T261_2503 [Streptomyces lydicus]
MLVAESEERARFAARIAEGPRLEFINGRLGVKAAPDGNHSEITAWLQRRCLESRPEWGLYGGRGLKVQADHQGRARPCAALAPRGAFAGRGEWADPGSVLMAVEVAPYDGDSQNRKERRRAYAEAGIPAYLLIDREDRRAAAYSEPGGGRYRCRTIVSFGLRLSLPAPAGLDLDTEPLTAWASPR